MSLSNAIARLAPTPKPFQPGHVWLAGAGPGALDCVTLGVISALANADAVVYDALVDPELLKAADGAELHFVGKRAGKPSTPQDAINALIVRLAQDGKRVLRLKGGDPNIFGRGGEEASVLAKAGIPFRFLPGVTSGLAALAGCGIPATMRGINKAIVLATGHAAGTPDDLDWHALAKTGQPIVIYMGVGNLPVIVNKLASGGLLPTTPVAIIMQASTPQERVIVADLRSIVERAHAETVIAPALIVVGEIVGKRDELTRILETAGAL